MASVDDVLTGTDSLVVANSLVGPDSLVTTGADELAWVADPGAGGAAAFEVQPAAASALATTATVSLDNRDTRAPC